jgi:hypothetical protein
VEATLHAGDDSRAMVLRRLTRTRALAGVRQERPAISAQERERAIAVLVHREGALLGVDGPRVPARTVVVGDHVVRAELAVLALTFAVAGIREAGRRKGEGGHEEPRQNPTLPHLSLPPDFVACTQ